MHFSLQDGATALMKASKEGQVECVKLLLDASVQVNVQNGVSAVLIKLQVTMWMHIQCMAKYGYNIQLYGGLGMRHSSICVVSSGVEECGDS